MKRLLLLAVLVVAALALADTARALTVAGPGFAVSVPVYVGPTYVPPPVYYAPPPVYAEPVYVGPAYYPAPVYVGPGPYIGPRAYGPPLPRPVALGAPAIPGPRPGFAPGPVPGPMPPRLR